MKKIILTALSAIIVFSLIATVSFAHYSANDLEDFYDQYFPSQTSEPTVEPTVTPTPEPTVIPERTFDFKPIVDVIKEQNYVNENSAIYDKDRYCYGYDFDLGGYDFSDDFIIRNYSRSLLLLKDENFDLDKMEEELMNPQYEDLLIDHDGVYMLVSDLYLLDGYTLRCMYKSDIPGYLTDIYNSSIYDSDKIVKGTDCKRVIVASDWLGPRYGTNGVAVFYEFDYTTLVWFYPQNSYKHIEFILSDFADCMKALFDYKVEHGKEGFGGPPKSVEEFVTEFAAQIKENDTTSRIVAMSFCVPRSCHLNLSS